MTGIKTVLFANCTVNGFFLDWIRRFPIPLTHPEYKRIFGQMAKDEKDHDNLVEGLKDLLVE